MKPLRNSVLLTGCVVFALSVLFLRPVPQRPVQTNGATGSNAPQESAAPNLSMPASPFAIVCHITHNFMTVVDTKDNRVIDTIQADNGDDWITIDNSTHKAYVANFNSNDLSVINTRDTRECKQIPAGMHPVCVRLTPDGRTALISHQSQDGLWFMNSKDYKVTTKIIEGTGFIYYLKTQKLFYQPAIFSPFIHIINPVKQSIVKSVWVGGRPMSLAFTPDGKYAYIPNYDLKEVQVFDTRIDTVVKVIHDIPDPRGIAITPDGKYALVTNVTSGTVTVIGIDSNAVVKVIPVDKMPTDVKVTANGKYAYVSNQGASSVSVISLAKLEVVGHIEVADNPITIFLF